MPAQLTKSQRVKVIKDIAGHMESEDWTTIDLTLKQFYLPISAEWSGDRASYVVDKIGEAGDGLLRELAEHFGIDGYVIDNDFSPQVEPPFWQEGSLKIFLSHLTAQKEQASKIKDALSKFGMTGFVAHADIEPALEWQIEIETALSTCDLLVAILHPGFLESRWCDQEIGYALGRGIPVFTIRCGLDPYGFVSRFHGFNGNGKAPPELAQELFDAAVVHKKLQNQMAAILVSRFISSGSFANAKSRIGYLEKLTVWDESFSKRLKDALKNNDQINGSWGVPDRVNSLIKKWKAS